MFGGHHSDDHDEYCQNHVRQRNRDDLLLSIDNPFVVPQGNVVQYTKGGQHVRPDEPQPDERKKRQRRIQKLETFLVERSEIDLGFFYLVLSGLAALLFLLIGRFQRRRLAALENSSQGQFAPGHQQPAHGKLVQDDQPQNQPQGIDEAAGQDTSRIEKSGNGQQDEKNG